MKANRPYKYVLDFLKENIAQLNYEPNRKLPSERMLALKFNVSRRSVRLAYNHLIEKNLVSRVHGKGYYTSAQPSDGQTPAPHKEIYLIIPSIKSSFCHEIFIGIVDFFDEHSLDVSLKFSNGELLKENQYIDYALKSEAKGIILFPIDNETFNDNLLKLSTNRYPLTIVDRYFKSLNASFVASDNVNAMYEAVKFLKSNNVENFIYLTNASSLATSVEERLEGFKEGIMKFYGTTPDDFLLTLENFSPNVLIKKLTKYFSTHPIPKVIIIPGVQYIVDSIMVVLTKFNLSPIKDIKFMLFDNDLNYQVTSYLQPYVILQKAYQIGYESAALLYNQMYGDLRTETKLFPVDIFDYSKKQ